MWRAVGGERVRPGQAIRRVETGGRCGPEEAMGASWESLWEGRRTGMCVFIPPVRVGPHGQARGPQRDWGREAGL